jgi:hypothetical protein
LQRYAQILPLPEIHTEYVKNRETILLIVVALFGIGGLVALQMSRKSNGRNAERALVQAENQQTSADPQASAPIERIPGELLRTSLYPEAGQPFRFIMSKFSQGAVYELDMGDGSPRKAFANGMVEHTFKKSGPCCVTLYARFEDQVVQLDTMCKRVANRKREEIVAPIVDY